MLLPSITTVPPKFSIAPPAANDEQPLIVELVMVTVPSLKIAAPDSVDEQPLMVEFDKMLSMPSLKIAPPSPAEESVIVEVASSPVFGFCVLELVMVSVPWLRMAPPKVEEEPFASARPSSWTLVPRRCSGSGTGSRRKSQQGNKC